MEWTWMSFWRWPKMPPTSKNSDRSEWIMLIILKQCKIIKFLTPSPSLSTTSSASTSLKGGTIGLKSASKPQSTSPNSSTANWCRHSKSMSNTQVTPLPFRPDKWNQPVCLLGNLREGNHHRSHVPKQSRGRQPNHRPKNHQNKPPLGGLLIPIITVWWFLLHLCGDVPFRGARLFLLLIRRQGRKLAKELHKEIALRLLPQQEQSPQGRKDWPLPLKEEHVPLGCSPSP